MEPLSFKDLFIIKSESQWEREEERESSTCWLNFPDGFNGQDHVRLKLQLRASPGSPRCCTGSGFSQTHYQEAVSEVQQQAWSEIVAVKILALNVSRSHMDRGSNPSASIFHLASC